MRPKVQVALGFLDENRVRPEGLFAGENECFIQVQNEVSSFVEFVFYDVHVHSERKLRRVDQQQSPQLLYRVVVAL